MEHGKRVFFRPPPVAGRSLFRAMAVLLCFHIATAMAAPSIENAAIRNGLSPTMSPYSWAELRCLLKNPDSKRRVVELRLLDAAHGFGGTKTVFSCRIAIPPKTSIRYKTPVMVETSDQHRVEMFMDGRRIAKTAKFPIRISTKKRRQVAILNDSIDVTLGSFANFPALRDLRPRLLSSRTPISQWPLLSDTLFAVVLKPDFNRYRESSFRALLDYVRRGGTILFLDPEGLAAAAKTPLAELLPMKPLKTRRVETIPGLETFVPSFDGFPKPVDFAESIPNGDGATMLEAWGCPVLRWKRYGMGLALASAFPCVRESFTRHDAWQKMSSAVFTRQSFAGNNSSVVKALDEMTGITIPSASIPRTIIALYFLFLAIPLAFGLRLRKNGLAWLAGGVVSLVFTAAILHKASSISGGRKGIFLSFVEIAARGPGGAAIDSYYNVMSTSDGTVTLAPSLRPAVISALPPPETIFMLARSASGPPLEVETVDGERKLRGLRLPPNAPRQFEVATSSMESHAIAEPKATLGPKGIDLEPWTVPEKLEPEAAWLLLPNAVEPLDMAGGVIRQRKSSSAILGAGPVEHALRSFLKENNASSCAAVAIVENSTSPAIDASERTINHGKRITLLPIRLAASAGAISLSTGWFTIRPADSTTKLIMRGNAFLPKIVSRTENNYLVAFETPPIFSSIKPKRIKLSLKYFNKGGNISVTPRLVVAKRDSKDKVSILKKLEGTAESDGSVAFDNPRQAFSNGTGVISLEVRLKNKNLPMGETIKANTWSVERLDIQIEGEMPGPAGKGFTL